MDNKKCSYSNFKRVVVLASIIFFYFIHSFKAFSQDVQLWADGFIYKQFGASIEYELNPGMSRLLVKDGWRDFYLNNTITYQPFGWFVADGSVELHTIKDNDGPNINEVRPFLGTRVEWPGFIRAIHLYRPYIYVRYEQRFLWYPEEGTQDVKSRTRARVGGKFILNSDAFDAKTFYIPFLFEYYINLNGEAVERYANRNRGMIGLGYVINSKWRSEINYHVFRSRNSADDDFTKSEMAVQVQLKYYFQYQTL